MDSIGWCSSDSEGILSEKGKRRYYYCWLTLMLKLEAKKEWTHHLSSEVIRRTGVLRQPDYNITSNYGNDNVGGVNNNSNNSNRNRNDEMASATCLSIGSEQLIIMIPFSSSSSRCRRSSSSSFFSISGINTYKWGGSISIRSSSSSTILHRIRRFRAAPRTS